MGFIASHSTKIVLNVILIGSTSTRVWPKKQPSPFKNIDKFHQFNQTVGLRFAKASKIDGPNTDWDVLEKLKWCYTENELQ